MEDSRHHDNNKNQNKNTNINTTCIFKLLWSAKRIKIGIWTHGVLWIVSTENHKTAKRQALCDLKITAINLPNVYVDWEKSYTMCLVCCTFRIVSSNWNDIWYLEYQVWQLNFFVAFLLLVKRFACFAPNMLHTNMLRVHHLPVFHAEMTIAVKYIVDLENHLRT